MSKSKIGDIISRDIRVTTQKLREDGLIRDWQHVTEKRKKGGELAISFSTKNEHNKVMFDENLTVSELMKELLIHKQYTLLLYDKSIMQAEYCIRRESIMRERLVFIKKHNKIWNRDVIYQADEDDNDDWFNKDKGVPIIVRIDCDAEEARERHPYVHMTISNHKSCRIPMKRVVFFSEFVMFIMRHFYDYDLKTSRISEQIETTLTPEEIQAFHLNWS